MPQPDRFGVLYNAPVLMTFTERVVLYGTVFGQRPARCLEIGTHQGGSAAIIVAALDDVGAGSLVCIDPNPVVTPETWGQISHRATLIAGGSPEVLLKAREAAGGPFDFALIDGDHELPGVVRDIEGTLPLLAHEAHLLFHDAHFGPVGEAIDQMLEKYAGALVDCGMMSVETTPDPTPGISWGGLRMLRYTTRARRAEAHAPAPSRLLRGLLSRSKALAGR